MEIIDRSGPIGDDIEFDCAVRFGDGFAREAHAMWVVLNEENTVGVRPFKHHC